MTYQDPQLGAQRPAGMSPLAKTITVVTAITGAIALVFAGGTAIARTAIDSPTNPASYAPQFASTEGVNSIRIDSSASEFTLEFAPVDQAELTIDGSVGRSWSLTRDGDTLKVKPHSAWCFGFCFGGSVVTLTLPESIEGPGLELEVDQAAGIFQATGSFGMVDVEMAAGSATLDLADVKTASFNLAAGQLTARLSGDAPDLVDIEIAAGTMTLRLPSANYRVNQDVGAGSIEVGVPTNPSSTNEINAEVMAGSLELKVD